MTCLVSSFGHRSLYKTYLTACQFRHGSQLAEQQFQNWTQQLSKAIQGPAKPLSPAHLQRGAPDQDALWLLRLLADLAAAWPQSLGGSSASDSALSMGQLTGWRADWKVRPFAKKEI